MSWNIAKPGDQINGPVAVTGNLNVDSNTLFVDSANNRVGVLTASPTVPLDVVGDAKVSGNLTVDTNTFVVDAANDRVGIGTATPLGRLHVNASGANTLGSILSHMGGGDQDFKLVARNGSGSSGLSESARFGLEWQPTSGSGNWNSGFRFLRGGGGADGYLIACTSGQDRLTIDIAGNLGVGVTPATKFDVALAGGGTPRLRFTSANDDPIIESQRWSGGGSNYFGTRLIHSGGFYFQTAPAASVGSQTFTTRMVIDTSGNLSVGGTPTGTGKFEIQGTTAGERILFSQTANNTSARTMFSIGYRTGALPASGFNAIVCATETQFDDSYGVKILSGPTAAVGIHVNKDGRIGIGMADSMLNRMQVQGAGQATTTVSDNGDGSALFLSDTGAAANNGGLLFLGSASTNGQRPHVGIKSLLNDGTANGTGDMAFLTRTTTASTTLTEKMRLLTNGNLALGRTSALFGSVSGRTTFTIDGSAGSIISWGFNGTVSTYIVADAAGTELGEARNQPVRFITNSTERLRIKSTGQTRFVPLASAPASPEVGDVYYDSSTNKLRCYNGTTWNDLF